MNVNEYFKRVSEKLDNLTDEEFLNLLVESGLEECPFEASFNVPVRFGKESIYGVENKPIIINTIYQEAA